jgi:predicted deacylase
MILDHSQSDRAGIHSNRPSASRRAALWRVCPFALVGLLAITTHVAGNTPGPTASAAPRHAPAIEPRLTLRPPTNLPRIVPLIAPVLSIAPPVSAAPQGVAIALGLSDDRETPVERLSTRLLSDAPATAADPGHPERVPVETSVAEVAPFRLLREEIAPGSFAQLTWLPTETFASAAIPAAVLVAHGSTPGPVVCLTAAIHGDELNGIETVRRIMHDLDPVRLSGTVIGVPIVNIQGFHRGSRYLPDRRDLNRFFPGNRSGSSASRIAHSLFYNIVTRCNALVDLHTGSFQRANLPQIRADLNDPGVVGLTRQFGSMVVLHGVGAKGTLRRAATDAGIPAVTLEAGGPMEVQQEAVASSELGIRALLDGMGMYRELEVRVPPAPAYYQSRWVRTDHGGILSSKVELGHQVLIGDLLGTVVDPLTNQQQEIRSPLRGRVIGMAHDQFVMPGYATFHIGIEGQPEEAIDGREEPDSELEAAEFDQGFDPS